MKVAVIGSTHAGVFAAKQIKAEVPDAEVHVFEKNQTVSFLSCGIALWIGDHVSSTERMFTNHLNH
ncbi:NADH oxidase [Weissella viridescens]|uniref:NADH oxidase n=1 Tax=Weissella viridescens TaxID=1629 RepID=A0A380NY81_WEIVI|nr:NADH oxidase [Weissella viridescens]